MAVGDSSLSGGFGCNVPNLLPLFRSKTRILSIVVLEAYKRRACASIARSSNPQYVPHYSTGHLPSKFPFKSNICIRLLPGSVAYTFFSLGSTATDVISLNCPSPFPDPPQCP